MGVGLPTCILTLNSPLLTLYYGVLPVIKNYNYRGKRIMSGHRIDRVSEDIRREIIAVIRELKDPRVKDKMLTVVRVEVSSDATYAKVYVSALEGIDTAKEAVKGLLSATGYIRREVGTRLRLRKTPELKFIADDSVEKGIDMFRKLEKARGDEIDEG